MRILIGYEKNKTGTVTKIRAFNNQKLFEVKKGSQIP